MTLSDIFEKWNQIQSPDINPQLWPHGILKDAKNITGEETYLQQMLLAKLNICM